MRPFRLCLLLTLAALAASCSKSQPAGSEVLIGAAASLRGVMPELMGAYAQSHPTVKLTVSYGASGDLRQQVEGGAPIDVVVLAAGKPVDDLVKGHYADGATRKVIATNQLVLIGPKGGKAYTWATLDAVPATEKIAVGDPKTVPAGQYAQAALEKLGKWDALKDHLVFGNDVAAVLAYARRGEVAAAIVYKTETRGIGDIAQLEDLKGEAAPRIEVVAAVTTGSKSTTQARGFVEFLGSAEAQRVFASHDFGAP